MSSKFDFYLPESYEVVEDVPSFFDEPEFQRIRRELDEDPEVKVIDASTEVLDEDTSSVTFLYQGELGTLRKKAYMTCFEG